MPASSLLAGAAPLVEVGDAVLAVSVAGLTVGDDEKPAVSVSPRLGRATLPLMSQPLAVEAGQVRDETEVGL